MKLCLYINLGRREEIGKFSSDDTVALQGKSWASYQKLSVPQILYPSNNLLATRNLCMFLLFVPPFLRISIVSAHSEEMKEYSVLLHISYCYIKLDKEMVRILWFGYLEIEVAV